MTITQWLGKRGFASMRQKSGFWLISYRFGTKATFVYAAWLPDSYCLCLGIALRGKGRSITI